MDRRPTYVVVAGLKGGVGKSTTAVLMAAELGHLGYRVLLVDADPVSQTAYDWTQQAARAGYDLPFAVYAHPHGDRFVESVEDRAREVPTRHQRGSGSTTSPGAPAQVVIIDTGSDATITFERAGFLADEVVCPTAPTAADARRLEPTRRAVSQQAALSGRDPGYQVLLVRVPPHGHDVTVWREYLESNGWPVMESQVPDRAEVRRAFGTVPDPGSPYAAVVSELFDLQPEEPHRA